MKKVLFIVMFLLAVAGLSAQVHFEPCYLPGNPYMAMTVLVNSAKINEEDMEAGDEIGIFDGDLCVGAGILTNTIPPMLQIAATADDPTTPEIDGFVEGNDISFRLWDNSEQFEIPQVIAMYDPMMDDIFTPLGTALVDLSSGPIHFETCFWPGNPYMAMTILVNSAKIDEEDMEAGDEIGIFDGDLCVGAGILTNTIPPILQIAAGADDPDTPEIDGFVEGNNIIFKLWDSNKEEEITQVTAHFDPLFDNVFASLGTALVDLSSRHFEPCYLPSNPFMSMTIFVNSAVIDNEDMEAGDEIGIFDGDLCVGSGVLINTIPPILQIEAGADDPDTPEVDGFVEGNDIIFKFWDSSKEEEITQVTAHFDPSYDTVFTPLGTAFVDLVNGYFEPCYKPGNPFMPMTILVNSAQIDNEDMQAGDEIGIFDGDLCVGAGILTNTIPPILQISATADDPGTPEVDGFIQGNDIVIKLWDNSESYEITQVTTYFEPIFDSLFTILGTALIDISANGPGAGTIEGNVTLFNGAGNVENVEVTANGVTTHPDINGDYSLTIQPGTYDVTASLTGYTSETITNVPVINGQVTTGIDFTLMVYGPGWDVDPTQYLYSGNIVCQVYYSDSTLFPTEQKDLFAAFHNNECRGVQESYEFPPGSGSYIFFLTVYSNETSGDILNFKLWDESTNLTKNIDQTIEFYPDMSYGTPLNPFNMYITVGIDNPPNISNTSLYNNPNPFKRNTKIQYSLSKPSQVTLQIFNIKGQIVKTLVEDRKDSGTYSIIVNANDLQMKNGLYFYKLTTDHDSVVSKMVLCR